MSVVALVGAQYGSEGKGLIAEKLAHKFNVHVRTGAPNAGHTYYISCPHPDSGREIINEDGQGHTEYGCSYCGYRSRDEFDLRRRAKVVARSVPCGASNPNAHLLIGAGGLIDVDLLIKEVQELDALGLDVSSRLWVDARCGVIDQHFHHEFEGGVHGTAHQRIGSTGEGVGPARMARIARGTFSSPAPTWTHFDQAGTPEIKEKLEAHGIAVHSDIAFTLSKWHEIGQTILLEGTQGCGLSLVHGEWPYVTSTDTNAAQLCVDSGISPKLLTDSILVARTYPIRVAGNSGKLENETSFEAIGVPEERTTVTKKVRRIGMWDDDLFRQAIVLNGPSPLVAITFLDYITPEDKNKTEWADLSAGSLAFIKSVESAHDVRVEMVGTGPDSVCIRPKTWKTWMR